MPKLLADMHVPSAIRRWSARVGLSLIVAIAIGYLPGQVVRKDPRTAKLNTQLDELDVERRELEARNAALLRDIQALRSDVGAIEDRARADLGMVYPDEVVLRVKETP
ncbi:MAG: septum formation initiator family protein [Polyangiales bacterium]